MENLSRKISDILVKKDIIECQNRNFYGYCIEVILLYFINLATIFIWAIFVGKFLECCFLLILISLLRNYCGGIHMNTWYSCYFITCALIGLILSICDEIIIDWYVLVPILLISTICIWKLAPCQHPNHELEPDIVLKCKKKAKIFTVLEMFVAIFLKLNKRETGVTLCCTTFILCTILLVLRKLTERRI